VSVSMRWSRAPALAPSCRGCATNAAHTIGMSNPTRAPAGTPEGGRFAPGRRAETGVTLDTASEEPGQVDPAILNEMARHRAAIAEAGQAYERACARGLADIATKRWPQAHALEMEPREDDPDHLVVVGVYSSGKGGRLPVTDAELHDFNFYNQDVFTMTSALQEAPAGQGSAYMSGDSKLLGPTFDVDKARRLRVTDEEIAQERVDRADTTISDVVAKHVPGARSWSIESGEYENGHFYNNQIAVYDGDADPVTYLGSRDSRVSPEDSAAVMFAVSDLNEVYEDENFHPHYHETKMP